MTEGTDAFIDQMIERYRRRPMLSRLLFGKARMDTLKVQERRIAADGVARLTDTARDKNYRDTPLATPVAHTGPKTATLKKSPIAKLSRRAPGGVAAEAVAETVARTAKAYTSTPISGTVMENLERVSATMSRSIVSEST